LVRLLNSQLYTSLVPTDYNLGLWNFPAKKIAPEEIGRNCVIRAPNELRPLTLNNFDNKIICSTAAASISPVICKSAHPIQNGFVHGRQLLQNPLELDLASRDFAHRSNANLQNFNFQTLIPSSQRMSRAWPLPFWPILLQHSRVSAMSGCSMCWNVLGPLNRLSTLGE